jgi:hypothetical protein
LIDYKLDDAVPGGIKATLERFDASSDVGGTVYSMRSINALPLVFCFDVGQAGPRNLTRARGIAPS